VCSYLEISAVPLPVQNAKDKEVLVELAVINLNVFNSLELKTKKLILDDRVVDWVVKVGPAV
jgi:hypothetical protein